LELGDPLLALGGSAAQFVERLVVAIAEHPAVARHCRRFIDDRLPEQLDEMRQRTQISENLVPQTGGTRSRASLIIARARDFRGKVGRAGARPSERLEVGAELRDLLE